MKNKARKPISVFKPLRGMIKIEEYSLQEAPRPQSKLIWITILFIIFLFVPCFAFAASSEKNSDASIPFDFVKGAIVVSTVALLIIIIFTTWNRILSRRVNERTAKLAESEERFRVTFEQAAVGIAHVAIDGRFIRINQKFCDIFGYNCHEMLNLTFQDIANPDDHSTGIEQAKQLLNGEINTYAIEKRYIRKNGGLIWTHLTVSLVRDKTGEPQWFVSVIKDITERKRTEEELRNSEHEKAVVLNNTAEIIALHDTEHNIKWANRAYLKATGLSLSELRGRKCYHSWGLDRFCKNCPVTVAIETGKHQEAKLTPENQKHWSFNQGSWIVRAAPVKDNTGSVVGAIEVAYDITDRERTEEEIQQLREEYTHITRIAAIGELTASIAHELKQPLAAIRSNAQAAQRFLTDENPDLDELHDILTDIIKDNRRADEIIDKLRTLMRKEHLQISEFNINEVIQELFPLIHSYEIMRGVSLEFEAHEKLPSVAVDRVQIQQVILNLLLNSSEALMEIRGDRREITIQTSQKDTHNITVAVKNNGPGIDEKNIVHLFDPFYTTKKEGLGIGLAISRSIIEAHKGSIWAENNSGRGVTFYFTLPIFKRSVE